MRNETTRLYRSGLFGLALTVLLLAVARSEELTFLAMELEPTPLSEQLVAAAFAWDDLMGRAGVKAAIAAVKSAIGAVTGAI